MISQDLQKLIGVAMKAGDKTRVETLRMLSSSFNYEKIAKQHELSDEEEIAVIRKQAKQRRESIEMYSKAGDRDRELKEAEELKILSEFLPPEMDENELIQLISDSINQLGAKTMADMGRVIADVKAKTNGNADGGLVATIVRQKLATSS